MMRTWQVESIGKGCYNREMLESMETSYLVDALLVDERVAFDLGCGQVTLMVGFYAGGVDGALMERP